MCARVRMCIHRFIHLCIYLHSVVTICMRICVCFHKVHYTALVRHDWICVQSFKIDMKLMISIPDLLIVNVVLLAASFISLIYIAAFVIFQCALLLTALV